MCPLETGPPRPRSRGATWARGAFFAPAFPDRLLEPAPWESSSWPRPCGNWLVVGFQMARVRRTVTVRGDDAVDDGEDVAPDADDDEPGDDEDDDGGDEELKADGDMGWAAASRARPFWLTGAVDEGTARSAPTVASSLLLEP